MSYYADPLVTLYLGNCLEVLPTLEADGVDAVVTDPPYGLGFMGKHWDHGVPAREFWAEMYRVAKPGAYLLAFGGTRTVHRIATNIEDVGWIIRDMLMWIYASGFPKGKANLKPAHEPIVLARKPGPLRPLGIDECRIGTGGGHEGAGPGPSQGILGEGLNGPRAQPVAGLGRWPSNVLLSDPELFDEPNPWVVGSGAVTVSNDPGTTHVQLPGWGMKPKRNTASYAADSGGYSRFFRVPSYGTIEQGATVGSDVAVGAPSDDHVYPSPLDYPSAFLIPKADRAERERGLAGGADGRATMSGGEFTADGRSASSVNHARPRANVHPTVKPIDLMRHLVRLVTPPGGVCLDPFLGSGTTALAASEEGFRCIGIEREPEYLEIAKGRLMATPMGLGLDVPAGTKPRKPSKAGAIGGNGLGSHYDRLGNTKRGVRFRDKPTEEDAA